MSLCTLIFIGLATSAAARDFLKQTEIEAKKDAMQQKVESQMTAEASALKSALSSKLAHYMTEEGKKEHEKAVRDTSAENLKDAAEELEWYSNVARDGIMDFGDFKFPLLDNKISAGKLPKGLPEFPTDPKQRQAFIEKLPVGPGTYSTMLALKKNPSKMVSVAQDEFKSALSLLEREDVSPIALVQQSIEEKHQKTVEILKAAPKEFKKALKSWEKIVPEAAAVLLQTASDESNQEAVHLAKRARHLHNNVYTAVEQVSNKAQLMGVAQNRITSLLMRQAEETIKDFDALEGCTDSAKDFSGAQMRCLCVADNICHKMEQESSGNTCSIVSSSTCMVPNKEEESKEMSTV
jgi:hypothetical protein